jgi:hypothetical protein
MKFETDIRQTGTEGDEEWSVTISFDQPVDGELFSHLSGCRPFKPGKSAVHRGAVSLRTERCLLVRFDGVDGREQAEIFLSNASVKLASMAPTPPDVV